ncbi:hypothetical protein H6P81_011664 [Aristolochia fimbriata]|uniref:Bidirectional sugar transporter SWEET n=1 Tax=Aristolochia fimbriata TaxID=158543 RepID=A0AAV7EAU4_ARIFI|nr:hypothetical protein H6P81_011664 [Aristolochia fimbriata]
MGFLVGGNPWVLVFGVLGNVISLMVLLAPVPTFYRICKKKSTQGFHSTPYLVTLFSATLWIYYALLDAHANLVITINSLTCVIQAVYIGLYLSYASKEARMVTLRWLLLLNVGAFSLVFLLTFFLIQGVVERVKVMGWICMVFTISVFAAPLSIMRQVIRTKSVEFMPFPLSFFLTLSAVAWFFYGFFLRDYFVALPNILGFLFGIIQIGLYVIYRRNTIATTRTGGLSLPDLSSSLLFLLFLTFIGNFQESSGSRTGWGSVVLAEIVALVAASTVHRVCITTCFLFSIGLLYEVNKLSGMMLSKTEAKAKRL